MVSEKLKMRISLQVEPNKQTNKVEPDTYSKEQLSCDQAITA